MKDLLGLKGLSNDRLVAEFYSLFETERVATVKPPHGAFLVSQVRGDVTSFRIGAGSPDSLFTLVHEDQLRRFINPSHLHRVLVDANLKFFNYLPKSAIKGSGEYAYRALNHFTKGCVVKRAGEIADRVNKADLVCW